MTKTVFISYRRDDTAAAAGRIYDRLVRILPKRNVFLDVDTVVGGENFERRIQTAIESSDAALIFIGDRWLAPSSESGSARIWAPGDYVRTEIRAALSRPMLVLPVLVGNVRMPAPDALPEDVRQLASRNALTLRHEAFDDDCETIVAAIVGASARRRSWEERPRLWTRLLYVFAGALVFFLLTTLLAMIHVALLGQPLAASIGELTTTLLLILNPVIGAILGWRVGARK